MKRKFLFIVLIVSFEFVFSQKESANWYFGDFAGLGFKTGIPAPLLNGQLVTKEGCASISDVNGNLLFYTDGITVWDRRHQIMPNGIGLLGHVSSTESALIVPKPGNRLVYYIFTVDRPSYFQSPGDPIDGVNYTEVDLSLNNGYGDVVLNKKNIHLITYDVNNATEKEFKSSEKISAVSHNDGSSVWILTQFVNKFYAFKIESSGVNPIPIISTTPGSVQILIDDNDTNISAIGYLKISPNGRRIAIAHSSTSLGSPKAGKKASGKVLLYDFNNSTGVVSNEKIILNNDYPYGIEFSPNSKLLYVTVNEFNSNDVFVNSYLQQYNLESSNIPESLNIISVSRNVAGALQLALDAKIYRAGYEVFKKGLALSVINKPNEMGSASNYSHNSVDLGGPTTQIGLPIFVQSIFLASFEYENTCLGDNTHFYMTSEEPFESALWDFGDGTFSSDAESYHTYDLAGVYKVSLTLTINGIDLEPFLKEVIITEPIAVLQNTFDMIQCDFFDNDPNDGISTFNLQSANAPLTFNASEPIQAYYYHTIAEATNDGQNVYALDDVYINQSQNELLYAKIYKTNTDCYSTATVRLITVRPIDLGLNELNACVYQSEIYGNFDLKAKAEEIRTNFMLSNNASISFHETLNEAALSKGALPDVYYASSKRIYIRADNENACYGTGTLDLYLKPFPRLENQSISVCSYNFPILINSGINGNQLNTYNYSWNTGEDSSEILVTEPGAYSVIVNDPVLGCGKTVAIQVNLIGVAEILELVTNDKTLKILLTPSPEKFVFSVDNENGHYQESNTFNGLKPGLHRVFIRDINNCHSIYEDFYIFGFPKYFTPNGDGQNDTWNVYGLDSNDLDSIDITIKIFNRYGKLLKMFNPLKSLGWNGIFRGVTLPSDDYWYYVKLSNGKEYSGHFTLKK